VCQSGLSVAKRYARLSDAGRARSQARAPFRVRSMRTIEWDEATSSVRIIDQRALPGELRLVHLRTAEQVADAIRDMAIRGAPAIGAAAAFGLAMAALQAGPQEPDAMLRELERNGDHLLGSRPTAVNLRWAVERMLRVARSSIDAGDENLPRRMLETAQRIAEEDVQANRRIGQHGAVLIHDGDTVLHHCNTGSLATVDFGTALGVIRTAHEQGKRVHVLVDETRPRLQGARLTAWELGQLGISHEIISDGAAGHFLRRGQVAAVFVGADRVATNGDVANKIGTYMLALAAHDNQVPFYAVLPTSTIDLSLSSGEQIPIEERDPAEVLGLQQDGFAIAPAGSRARNPAFDVTPNRLVSAIVTEVGILRPPYSTSLSSAAAEAQG